MDEVRKSLARIAARLDDFISREELDKREGRVVAVIHGLRRAIVGFYVLSVAVIMVSTGYVLGNQVLCAKADESKTALRNVVGLAVSIQPSTTTPHFTDPELQRQADEQARQQEAQAREFAEKFPALVRPIDCSITGPNGPFARWRTVLVLTASAAIPAGLVLWIVMFRQPKCAFEWVCRWRKRRRE